jgi:peroxiredoxin
MNKLFRFTVFAIGFLGLASIGTPHVALADEGKPTSGEVLNFALLDHRGRMHELRRGGGSAVVLFFTANECPIARQSASKLRKLREAFSERGVSVFMVNSNPADDRKSISKEMTDLGAWHLPVLKDDTQGVARHLGVKRTGETIAINTKDWTVFYRGAIDDQMVEGAQKPQPTERYLENALNEFLDGKPVHTAKTVARGCVIHFDGGEGPDAASVSYAKDVAPILEHKCVHCHSPGNIGSWSMSSHQKVKGMASMIEEVLLARRMPPWDADPAIGKFSNDASLSVAEAQTLLRWVHQGAPRGEGEDPLTTAEFKPIPDWPLGPPDLVLRLPSAENIPATGVLDYRHIQVFAGNTNEAWVGGIWVKPDNKKVVHHIIARLKEGGRKDNLGQGEMFAGWAPGATQGRFPQGSGKFLPANAKFDFEMHYTPNGTPQTDQSEIGLYLLKEKPARRFESVPVVNTTFEIQPNDPAAQAQGMYGFKEGATLHSVTPHMHLRGRSMKFDALYPDGRRETICSVPRYNFNWQQTYVLAKPKKIPAGSWAVLSGTWDNSPFNPANPNPKKIVHWGDQSFDEMFLGWYNVTWDAEPTQQVSATQ